MNFFFSISALSIALSIAAVAVASPLASHTLHYKNQRGSTLIITGKPTAANSGKISGTFASAVASKKCQQVIGKRVPVVGYYDGNAISLSIAYPQCGAVISMVGNFDRDKRIQTLWIDAHQAQAVEKKQWNTRFIGHDTFKLIR